MIKQTDQSNSDLKSVGDTFIPFVQERDSVGRMFTQTLVNNRLKTNIIEERRIAASSSHLHDQYNRSMSHGARLKMNRTDMSMKDNLHTATQSQFQKTSDEVIKKGEVILPSALAKSGFEGDKASQN